MQAAPAITGWRSFPVWLYEHFCRIMHRRETIRYLVSSNLKAGNRDKLLGHLWNLLDPLLFIGVYYLVFGNIFAQGKSGRGTFIIYLSIGVLTWRFIDGAVEQATNCVRGSRGLIHEISFPKAVFPISVCFSRLYDLLWGLLVLLVVVLISGQFDHDLLPTVQVVWVFPLLVFTLALTLGFSFIASYLGAFFADTANIVTIVMRVLMYVSPTFYYDHADHGVHSRIPESWLHIYMLNPVTCLFDALRDAMLWGVVPDMKVMAYAAVSSVAILLVGFCLFAFGEGKFAKYI